MYARQPMLKDIYCYGYVIIFHVFNYTCIQYALDIFVFKGRFSMNDERKFVPNLKTNDSFQHLDVVEDRLESVVDVLQS